ncbi:hypothetical protein IAF18_18175, partial [Acinetobacter baumannii]|nr:hypothetical protein [Acinetobacter baumannii]
VTPTVNEEGVPTEAFGLKYAAVEWTYNQQDINRETQRIYLSFRTFLFLI